MWGLKRASVFSSHFCYDDTAHSGVDFSCGEVQKFLVTPHSTFSAVMVTLTPLALPGVKGLDLCVERVHVKLIWRAVGQGSVQRGRGTGFLSTRALSAEIMGSALSLW